jgi:hypothetical protein
VASTFGPPNPAGQNTTLLGGGVGAIRVPLADETLSARWWLWLCADCLPALGQTGTPLERHFIQQSATFGHILARQGDEAAAFRQAELADKEFEQLYPHAAVGYQMLSEAQTPAALPPLLKILANTKKKDAAMVIQHALDARAQMPDSTGVSPVVTPEMIENIYDFKAGAQDVDDLISGFTPYLFATGSLEATTLARVRTVTYSHLHGGHVAPSLDQIREIVTGAPQMTHTLVALERCYQGYSTFLDLMIGQDHRTALHFREFLRIFQGLKQELEDDFGSALHTVLPLFLQRHTQLTMIRHFNDATLRGAFAPLPRIMDLVDIIQFKRWPQLIPIPPRYLVPRGTNPQPTPPPPAFAPALPPAIAPALPPAVAPAPAHAAAPSVREQNVAPDTGLLARFARTTRRLKPMLSIKNLFPSKSSLKATAAGAPPKSSLAGSSTPSTKPWNCRHIATNVSVPSLTTCGIENASPSKNGNRP